MGANMGSPDTKLVLTHTSEIADAAAEELLSLSFTGSSVRYIASDERSTIEIANVLGNAIGKESLQWIPFSDEQMKEVYYRQAWPKHLHKDIRRWALLYAVVKWKLITGTTVLQSLGTSSWKILQKNLQQCLTHLNFKERQVSPAVLSL